MNTNRKTDRSRGISVLLQRRGVRLALAIAVAVGLAAAAYAIWTRDRKDSSAVATAEVQRGPLVISVAESGTVQSRQRVVVKSEVEGTTTILYLVAEGPVVKKGDLLVELDSSRLQDEKAQQQITVLNAEAGFIHARENLAVTKSQADSDVAKAELTYKFAQQDLTKYVEGEYPRQLEQAAADINIAKEELQRAQDKLGWSQRLAQEDTSLARSFRPTNWPPSERTSTWAWPSRRWTC